MELDLDAICRTRGRLPEWKNSSYSLQIPRGRWESVVFQRLEIDGIKLEGNFIKKIDWGTKLLLEYLLYLYVLCPGSFL
jgi:hypothetical protein